MQQQPIIKAALRFLSQLFTLFTLIFVLRVSTASRAATPPLKEVSLAELSQELKYFQSIERLDAEFSSVKVLKDMNIEINSKGKLSIIRPDTVIWEVTQPSPMRVQLNKDLIVIENGQGAEKQQQSIPLKSIGNDKATQSLTALISWLHLDAAAIFKLYDPYQIAPHHYLFKARDLSQSPFATLDAVLDPKGHMKDLVIEESSGDQMKIHFSKPKIKRILQK